MTLTTTNTMLAELDEITAAPSENRVLTGDRPTAPLHVGHYFGSLANRVLLQDRGVESFILIADYQVLTDRDITAAIDSHVHDIGLDYLAVGIDPARSTIFTHSAVPQLNQLLLPFLSLVSTSELDRNPTVKEEIAASGRDTVSGLMYTYPAHEAADILFCHATVVPVGDDQLPHVELTRHIARRFNDRYETVFTPPRALLSPTTRLTGLDGLTKMSKSRGNAILLRHTADETAALIRSAVTDAQRHISYAPQSRPEVSNLVLLAALCTDRPPEAVAANIGGGGAQALKRHVTEAVNEFFAPIRARRAELAQDRHLVSEILASGNARARDIAADTLQQVHEAMGTSY